LASSVNFSRIMRTIADVRNGAGGAPRLCVVGAENELRRVISILSAQAVDELSGVSGGIDALTPADFPREPKQAGRWDVVVVVAAGTAAADMLPVVNAAHRARRDVVGLIEAQAGAADAWAYDAGLQPDEIARGVAGSGTPTLENRIVHVLGDRAGALAARLPALRRTYCDHVVLTNAGQNAAIGAVIFIPGADMPAMTVNQVRMILKIANAYGEELGLDRALEIISVVGTGFVFRALARQALDFVPGFGWALKGAVGFSGTIAMGQAAIAYFEAGAPLRVSRMQRISRQLDRARAKLPKSIAGKLGGG
jgi:uncharacterized protein (DUF697 family)